MIKTLVLTALFAGLTITAESQTTAQQFTGIHAGGDACPPYTTDGENGCVYGGNIATDPSSARANLYDSTGTTFPCYTPYQCINPRATPPSINLSGTWSGYIPWQNGMGLSGTTTLATGSCYVTGGPVGPYLAIYTVTCSGVDTTGNAASKFIKYASYRETSRSGSFWQPLIPYYAYNQPAQWPQLTCYVQYPNVPDASSNVGGGTDDGH